MIFPKPSDAEVLEKQRQQTAYQRAYIDALVYGRGWVRYGWREPLAQDLNAEKHEQAKELGREEAPTPRGVV